MPELGTPGSVGAAGGQLPAATRHQVISCKKDEGIAEGRPHPWAYDTIKTLELDD